MRTAIFVYQTTPISISTRESGLELCGMNATTVPVPGGQDAHSLVFTPGVYKIDSDHCLEIEGDASLFEVVTARKENVPKLQLTSRASSTFTSLGAAALHAFLTIADAKQLANP